MSPFRLLICLIALSGLFAVTPASASAVPRSFFGLQDWAPPSSKEFRTIEGAGVGTYRAQLDWSVVERQPGARDWAPFDALVARAALARVRVLPVLLGSPPWAAPEPQEPPNPGGPTDAFMRFAADAAARYSAGGAFWVAHPELPQVAPTHWQVWNEPNFPAYWYNERPNAAEYVQFLRETRAAILSTSPAAKIVLAGLPETRQGVPAARFLRQIYAVPGSKDAFDVVAIHPYATGYRGVLGALVRQRRTMRRNGDGATPIWITEIGWSTGGRHSRFTTSEKGQAKRLRSLLHALLHARKREHIGLVVWFSLKDRRPVSGELNWWAIHTGLFRVNGTAKPAWRVLRRYGRR